jgi:uncharacterized protein (TIGR02145 family)
MRLVFFALAASLFFLQSCSSSDSKTYELVITPVPQEGGMVTPADGEFEADRTLEISATPNQHWVFSRWEGDHEGTDNPVIITLDSDKDIAAIFEKRDYTLTIETVGEGSVSERVVQQKTTEHPYGTVVELTAVPAEGWEFDGWEGDVESDENPLTLTIEGETTVTAVFTRIEYPLTINIVGEGDVEETVVQAKTTDYPEGTVVELTAVPDENWIFWEWSGDLEGDENPETITIDGPKEVTATFLRTYKLVTIAEPEEGGTVTPDDTVFVRDTDIEVEAIPNHGWRFVNWEGDFTGSVNPFELTMNGNKTIVANFERQEFLVDISTEGDGSVETELISGTATENGYLFESEVEFTAVAADGWEFSGWEGYITSSDNPIQVTITENIELIAIFEGQVPLVRTDSVSNISGNSADVTATVLDENAFEVIERGVCYAEHENPDLFDVCYDAELNTDDSFTVSITGLEPETEYFVRAYATSEAGTGFGEQLSFTTKLADIDGNVYEVVEIGEQVWMAENLRTSRYQNGDAIPEVSSGTDWASLSIGAWVYYNNDSSYDEVYGKLYNGYAALDDRNICPAGWRVPTDDDWKALELTAGLPEEEADTTGARGGFENTGGMLKDDNTNLWSPPNTGANNETGFTALPGASRNSLGLFDIIEGNAGVWWSTSQTDDDNAYSRKLRFDSSAIFREISDLNAGYSVRCVRE